MTGKRILELIALSLMLASCVSSQKKLQRRIENNGIKESIQFVREKYPEYFKSKDTIIHDTIVFSDTIRIKADTIKANLIDSNGVLLFSDSLISLKVYKATNKAEITIKEKDIAVKDTIPIQTKCPELMCPDIEVQQEKKQPWFFWLFFFLSIALNFYLIGKSFVNHVKRNV